MRRKTLEKLFRTITEEVGNPALKLMSISEWGTKETIVKQKHLSNFAEEVIILYRKEKLECVTYLLWFKILHRLHPNKPYWWLEMAANILSGYDWYGKKHKVKSIIGDKKWLLYLCHRATVRFNNKQLELGA